MTPGRSRTQASSSASAAISPPDSTKSPSETSSRLTRLDQPLVDAFEAAADDDDAGTVRRARQRALASAARRAGSSAGAGGCHAGRHRARARARRPSSPCQGRRRPACRRRCDACRWQRADVDRVQRPDAGRAAPCRRGLRQRARETSPGKSSGRWRATCSLVLRFNFGRAERPRSAWPRDRSSAPSFR